MHARTDEHSSIEADSPSVHEDDEPRGFNVIGYASGNLGLGVSARMLIKLLLDRGHPVSILDLDPGKGRARHDRSFDAQTVKSPAELPHAINLAILPIPELPDFFLDAPRVCERRDSLLPGFKYWHAPNRLNVAVVWWEMTVLPEMWIRALEAFDVVVAPSPFIRSTLEAHLSDVAVISAIHPFALTQRFEPSRDRFDLPKDVVLFVTSFEPLSDPERKNPFAAIDAFAQAFPSDARANLIIKLNNAGAASRAIAPILDRLRERCRNDPRLRIIDKTLSYPDVLCLYASCDVFVSLHRSEGLGFGLLEAMALGKPVIATGWSGNMAFMDQTNACLVNYKLIPVRANAAVYSSKTLGDAGVWADPDVTQAAAWMKKLVDDPQQRMAVGSRAAASVVHLQREAGKAKFVDELLAIRRHSSFFPVRGNASRIERLREALKTFAQQQEELSPYPQRVARKIRAAADRHLLWRFR